jgi:hypothetical protein
MSLRRSVFLGLPLLAVLLAITAVAFATTRYPDRLGDVKEGTGPDIASVTVSNTKTNVTFEVRFAAAPPLRVSVGEKWVDMLLVGIDVPPLGPPPAIPGGDWRGANFALGTHGPSGTGVMVRLSKGESRRLAGFRIVTSGPTLTFSIPRRGLGNPARFAFTVAAAREAEIETAGAVPDLAPARGTFRYSLTG